MEDSLVGIKKGSLQILEKLGAIKKNSRVYYKCLCDCGNYQDIGKSELMRDEPKCTSCKLKIRIGAKFGKLTVIKKLDKKNKWGGTYWVYKCECGTEKAVSSASVLKSRCCVNCATKIGKEASNWKGCGDLSSTYFSALIDGAKLRGLEFDLTIEFLWELFVKQNSKCAISNQDISLKRKRRVGKRPSSQTASIDRIDSRIGYTRENVQWVHKDINFMKRDLTQNKFIEICKLIAKYQDSR